LCGGVVPTDPATGEYSDAEWERNAMMHAMDEASRLYGYRLGSRDNQKAIAQALVEIARILFDNGDVEVTVARKAEGAEDDGRAKPPRD
jgi:hypothetical protein